MVIIRDEKTLELIVLNLTWNLRSYKLCNEQTSKTEAEAVVAGILIEDKKNCIIRFEPYEKQCQKILEWEDIQNKSRSSSSTH